MVEVKYIKRAGKLHGPYYYKSVRDSEGNVRKIYLGKTNPEAVKGVIPQKKYIKKALDINPLNILIIAAIFLVLIGLFFFFKGFPVTGQYAVSVNKLVSSNAYLEIDGISQAIPLELTKIGEDWYYNITTIDLNLTAGIHTVKVIDNSETVFEQNVLVGENGGAGNETSNETIGNETNESVPPPEGFGILGGDFGVAGSSSSGTETSKEWSMFKGHLNRTGVYNDSFSLAGFGKLWNYSTGGNVLSSPAVADGLVYFGSYDNKTYALNASNGSLVWNFTTNGSVASSPAIAGGIVYFGSLDNKTYALNASNGSLIWNFTTQGHVYSSPAVVNGIVYIGSDDNKTYALNASNGSLIWNFTTMGDIYTSSPAIVDNILYIGGREYNFYALNATNGSIIWNRTLAGDSIGTPAVYNNTVYLGSGDNRLYALNASNGSLVWTYSTNGWASSPAVANGLVYFGSYDKSLYALNASTGGYVWNFTTGGAIYSAPLFANGFLFMASNDNKTYILNASTGAHRWNYTTNNTISSSFAAANGIFYIGSSDTNLYAFTSLATGLTSCTTLNNQGRYELLNSVGSAGTCMNITVNNVRLDCQFYSINYSNSALGYGINISGNNTIISNCNINQTGLIADSYGIYSKAVQNLTLNTISVRTLGDSAHAISFQDTHNSTVTDSSIRGNGTSAYSLSFSDSTYNLFTNNRINISSNGGYAVLATTPYNNFTYNTITAEKGESAFVLFTANTLLANNTIIAGPSGGYALLVLGSDTKDNTIIQNTLIGNTNGGIADDDLGYGYPAQNIVKDNTINNSNIGISLQHTSGWNITNNSIYNSTVGVYFNHVNNILINGQNITGVLYSLYVMNYSYVNISNAVLGSRILLNNSNLTFINITFLNTTSLGLFELNTSLHYDNLSVANNVWRNLSSNITIGYNFISLDSNNIPEFNVTANLTFYIQKWLTATPSVLRDDAACSGDICTNKIYTLATGALTVDVSKFTNYSVSTDPSSACINLSDSSSFGSAVTQNAAQNFNVSSSIKLCQQDYRFNGTINDFPVLNLNTTNTILNCDNSQLIGNFNGTIRPIATTSLNQGGGNITIKNCHFVNYSDGFYASGSGGKLIRNITFVNNTLLNIGPNGNCIRFENVSYIYVVNNSVVNCTKSDAEGTLRGISFNGLPTTEHVLIEGNTISKISSNFMSMGIGALCDADLWAGISSTNNITIVNNVINNVSGPTLSIGIWFIGINLNASYNNITNTQYGVVTSGGGVSNNIYRNTMTNCSVGIGTGNNIIFLVAAVNYTLSGNLIYNPRLIGISLWNSSNLTAFNNFINTSKTGILLNYTYNNTFTYNNITNATVGVVEINSLGNSSFIQNNLSGIDKYDYVFGLNNIDANCNILADTIAWYNGSLSNLTGNVYDNVKIGNNIIAVNSTGLPGQWNSSVNVSLTVSCGGYTGLIYNESYKPVTITSLRVNSQVVASSSSTVCSSPGKCSGIICNSGTLRMNISSFSTYGAESCVNLSSSSTWDNRVTNNTAQTFNISLSTTLCTQDYFFNGTGSSQVLLLNTTGITFDCAGSRLIGNKSGDWAAGIKASNVTIKNCNFVNYSGGIAVNDNTRYIGGPYIINNTFSDLVGNSEDITAIRFYNASYGWIVNNTINNLVETGSGGAYGIYLEGYPLISHVLIQNNKLVNISRVGGNGYGIAIYNGNLDNCDYVSNITISNNLLQNMTFGMYLWGASLNLSYNNLSNTVTGLRIGGNGTNFVFKNDIQNSFIGVFIGYPEHRAGGKNYTLIANTIRNTSSVALKLWNVSNSTFVNNLINVSIRGIFLNISYNNSFSYNNITNATVGVEELNSIGGNAFAENNLSLITKYDYVFGLNESGAGFAIQNDTIAWYAGELGNLTGNVYANVKIGGNITAVNITGLGLQWNNSANVSISYANCTSFTILFTETYLTNMSSILADGRNVASQSGTGCTEPGRCNGIACNSNRLRMNVSSFSSYGVFTDVTPPLVSFSATPNTVTSGGVVSVSCSATDNHRMASISVNSPSSGLICSGVASCSGSYSPSQSETLTCTAVDVVGNRASVSASITVSGDGGEPPPTPPPPVQPMQEARVEIPSRGNFTLIQLPQGILKFYYTEEGKPQLDLSFDVSSLAYYKPISLTYVPWFIYVIAVIMLIVITFIGTTVAENKEEIIERFRNLRRK